MIPAENFDPVHPQKPFVAKQMPFILFLLEKAIFAVLKNTLG